jgi:hypothetical protein
LLNKVLGWPGGGSQASGAGPALSQGIWGTVISLALVLVTYYVVLRGFLGRFRHRLFQPLRPFGRRRHWSRALERT